MSLEIFTVATELNLGYTRFASGLLPFGMQPNVRGTGETFYGYAWRFKKLVSAVRQSASPVILFADAYDTLCLANPLLALERFQSFGHPIVFSFEPQKQPEPYLALNAGLMIADRTAFLDLFTDRLLNDLFPDHFNDQLQLQMLLSWQPDLFRLDIDSQLFFTSLSGAPIPPTHTPVFVHAPYGGAFPNSVTPELRTRSVSGEAPNTTGGG